MSEVKEARALPFQTGARELKLNNDTGLLKLIACVCMLCDHMGKMVFPYAYKLSATGRFASLVPKLNILRVIGRVAMPLYAYCIAVGCVYTRNIWKYFLRLIVMGVLVHPLYQEAMGHVPLNACPWLTQFWRVDKLYAYYYADNLNIFFTLSLAALIIACWKHEKYFFMVLAALLTWILRSRIDYGYRGVVLIILFYISLDKPLASFAAVFLYMLNWCMPYLFSTWRLSASSQIYALAALPLIYLPLKQRRVKLPKWFFYGFYPAHLMLIYIIITIKAK